MSAREADQSPRSPTRRGFIRLLGAAGGATAAGVGSQATGLSPVQRGQAIAPAIAVLGVGAAVQAGWLIGEIDPLGLDAPAEGLTADALKTQIRNTTRARQSYNRSTFIDNQNIIDGLSHTAYAEGKLAAIEDLNNQLTQQEVQDSAVTTAMDYITTVQKNYLKSWNEAVDEFETQWIALDNHPNLSPSSFYEPGSDVYSVVASDDTVTLANGSEFAVRRLRDNDTSTTTDYQWSLDQRGGDGGRSDIRFLTADGTDNYLSYVDWNPIWQKLDTIATEVNDGLITWVDGVYSDVQAGSLETEDLLTPREQAQLKSEDSGFAKAQSDLMALNVAVDLDREAEVYLPDIDATIYGSLGYTGDTELQVGSVDPDATDTDGNPIYPGSFYFTYDISRGEGTWGQYNEGIDGGQLTFTSEPYADTDYTVQTAAGETVELTADDFTDNGDGTWTADLSGDLETAITNVDSITFTSQTDETQYETIQLKEPFEIKGFTGDDGTEYESSSFERTEPQTDDNYITQEEWEAQQQKHEELIEKYEQSQSGGGAITIGGTEIPPKYAGVVIVILGALGILR